MERFSREGAVILSPFRARWPAGSAKDMNDDKRNEQCCIERQHAHVNEPGVDVRGEEAVLRMEAHGDGDDPEPEASREGEPDQQGPPAMDPVGGQPFPSGTVSPETTSLYRLWNRMADSASAYSATAISRAA